MKRKTALFLCTTLIIQMLFVINADAAEVGGLYISSLGACVMDYDTGEVLYEYNGSTPLVPASMTKIMSIYCIYDAIANGEISLDTVVPISQNVYRKSSNPEYQNVSPLYPGGTYTVDELIDVTVVYSALGAVAALAELVGGSEAGFVERMNKKTADMGIAAYFYDCGGIANNEMSPVAMATLARNIIRDYPDILTRSSKKWVNFKGRAYKSTNELLDVYYYEGADGLKTGKTSAAGFCLCSTAVRNGRRMIAVTMHSSTDDHRFTDSAKLLDYGFAHAPQVQSVPDDIKVTLNGGEISFSDEHPVIVDNRTLVPLRSVMEAMGKTVEWNSETRTITVSDELATVKLTVDSDIMYVRNTDNQQVSIGVPPQIINGRACLPIRAVAEAFGAAVGWESETKTVTITTKQ